MTDALLPVFYLPPLSWLHEFTKPGRRVILEQQESFPKQTYRNRCNIYGANGRLSLSIPVKHVRGAKMRDVEISYRERWPVLHWRSVESAYRRSPYFEFYEDKLRSLWDFHPDKLIDFNLNALSVIQSIMRTDKKFMLNEAFEKQPEDLDLRNRFSAKQESDYDMPEYYQVFSDRHGFLKDLSVLDLLCNIGPEAATYLSKINY